jgi:tetratricopeptide (TPR) repeat protein
MSVNLRDLSTTDLQRLGGLRESCSAPLACTEHGAPHPCELCELEGLLTISCTACGHTFTKGLASVMGRPCASGAEFALNGKIAFETEALAAFSTEDSKRQRDIKSSRKQNRRDENEAQVRRERALAERAERETRSRAESERSRERERSEADCLAELERARAGELRERTDGENWRTSLERAAREAGNTADSRSKLAALISGIAALVGAVLAWRLPLIDIASPSWLYLIAYIAVTMMSWARGVSALFGKKDAHRTLRWWSVIPWAFFSFGWPAIIGLTFCHLVAEFLSAGAYLKSLLLFSITGFVGIRTMMHGGIAFSMDKPWPTGGVRPDFKGKRSWWLWLAVLLTLSLNACIWQGISLSQLGASATGSSPTQATLLPILGVPSTSFGKNQLGKLVDAVNAADNLSQEQAPGLLPAVDSVLSQLNQIPRPVRGDRATAREQLNKGLILLNQNGPTAEAISMMQQAHKTDPLDVQIINDLGYALILAGRYKDAEDHLLKTLILAPKRPNAWTNLAQLRIASAPGDARANQEAARYLVVAYWFSRDRPKFLRYITDEAKSKKSSSQFAAACKQALTRLSPDFSVKN